MAVRKTKSRAGLEIKVLPGPDEVAKAGAEEFTKAAKDAIKRSGRFRVALAGGNTPSHIYERLAAEDGSKLEWEKIQVFMGDERNVPPDSNESNFRMAHETLLSKISIPPENVHRMKGELDANEAAQQYEEEIRQVFNLQPGQLPRFDLIMLGMGPDGHTASLFPGTEALKETSRLVVGNQVEKLNAWRITFTFPVLNHASEVMFTTCGDEKKEIMRKVLRGDPSGQTYPAQRVKPPNGRLLWLIDRASAAML